MTAERDMRCHNLSAPHVREKSMVDSQVSICSFYEPFDRGGREMANTRGVQPG